MASYGHPAAAAARPGQPMAYGVPVAPPSGPAGTFVPGTKIQVGNHRVVIQKYLSEGGFAHVYLVKLARAVDGTDLAVLKRVAVPDKDTLRGMRAEVETMKRLKGHRPIVTYIDSHASELRGGGYEVFLLMEYCNGGGLIDFMNTRLQHRLTEPEILNIFTDVAEGVACMHYLKPPLLHRDLKVENVLITASGSNKRRFKLCDFGSAAPPRPAPSTVVECRLMDEDVQKHTTLQYRSPEMIDVYRKQPLDEKSDIWALGVLLYKLCYYTTPFEDQGQLAILNASFRYPSYPVFSERLKLLIGSMLKENQESRPTIYDVLREACSMQGREVPLQDIYSGKPPPEPPVKDRAPAEARPQSTPVVGAVFSPPKPQQNVIPDVVPMRRGRPPTTSQAAETTKKPSPSPMRVVNGDPFAVLDSKPGAQVGGDELSSRFPTLDQFSLLHDRGANFDFDSQASARSGQDSRSISVAEKIADQAIASSASPPQALESARPSTTAPKPIARPPPAEPTTMPKISSAPAGRETSRAQTIINKNPDLQAITSSAPPSKYVSTGTMTLDAEPSPAMKREPSAEGFRSSSLPRQAAPDARPRAAPEASQPPIFRVPATASKPVLIDHSTSSRPSLEAGRPQAERRDLPLQVRSSARPRPASTHLEGVNPGDWAPNSRPGQALAAPQKVTSPPRAEDDSSIQTSVEFLRSMEDSEARKTEQSSRHGKKSSLHALSGTKNILAGKFGDAFKRFEGNAPQPGPPARTPSPLKEMGRRDVLPTDGSEAAGGPGEDDAAGEDLEDMSPEKRRDVEQRRLLDEERRVAAAQAEYRQRLAERDALGPTSGMPKSIGGVSRAVSIQNRVQSLLDEDQKSSSSVPRSAQGYGKYSDAATAASKVEKNLDKKLPDLPRKPVGAKPTGEAVAPSKGPTQQGISPAASAGNDANAQLSKPGVAPKPAAPRKPYHLNNPPTGGRVEPAPTARPPGGGAPAGNPASPGGGGDEYLRDFSKRFPSLSAIEMVERDLEPGSEKRSTE